MTDKTPQEIRAEREKIANAAPTGPTGDAPAELPADTKVRADGTVAKVRTEAGLRHRRTGTSGTGPA